MTAEYEALCKAVTTYLHANDFRPNYFAQDITRAPHTPEAQALRAGLEEAIATSSLSPDTLSDLTSLLVDTQEEVDAFLAALLAYAVADGPEPEEP